MEIYDKKAAEQIERSYQTPEIVNQRLRTLAALALRPGEAVLDAGCGTGLLLELEARAVANAGRAEGIDFSDDMLAYARQRCAGLEQVRLQQGSIETLPFDAAAFDALSCTQTLLYVKDLNAALQEIYRVLKPAGRIAIIETDWSGAILNNPDQEITAKIFEAWAKAVVNPGLPRSLKLLLKGLGFKALRVEAIPILNSGYSEYSFSAGMMNNLATTAVKQKLISIAESEAWLEGIDAVIQRDEYFFCINRFLFTAVK